MKGVPNYLKNIAKSVVYAAADVNKELMPSVSEFAETNKDFAKSTIARLKNPLSADKISMKAITDSKIYKNVDYGVRNLMQDLKTGNFYNKEREERDSGKFYGDMFEDNFDYFGDTEEKSDYSSVDESSITAGDKAIVKSLESSNAAVAGATVDALVRTTNAQIANSRANHAQMYIQNEKLFGGLHKDITILGQSLDTMYQMQYTYMKNIDSMMTKFFTNKQKIDEERNAMLKEMVEMQRNQYKSALEKDRELNRQKSAGKRRYSDIVGANGTLDITAYIDSIKDDIKNRREGSIFGSDGIFSVDTIMADFVMSPLKGITKGIVNTLIPEAIKLAKEDLDKSISGIFGNVIADITNKANNEGPFSLMGMIMNFLGVSTNVNKKINTGNYEKGAVPFDGITRKAIIDVIPAHLARIEAALTSGNERIYDYNKGKFVTRASVQEKYDKIHKRHVRNATYDLRDAMGSALERERSNIRISKGNNAADEYVLAQEEFFEYLHEVNGRFSPFKSAAGNNVDKRKYPHLYKYFNRIVRVYNNFDLDEKGRHTQYGVRMQVAGSVMSEKDSEENEYRSIERDPSNIIHRFLSSEIEKEMKAAGIQVGVGGKGKEVQSMLATTRDKLNNNVFDYLGMITKELMWQRQNWVAVGGGRSGGAEGRAAGFIRGNGGFLRPAGVTDFGSIVLGENLEYKAAVEAAAREERERQARTKKDPAYTAIQKIIDHKYGDNNMLESFTEEERNALFNIKLKSKLKGAYIDDIVANLSESSEDFSMSEKEKRTLANFITDRVLWLNEQSYQIRRRAVENGTDDGLADEEAEESSKGLFGKVKGFFANIKSGAGGISGAAKSLFTDMLYAADKAIYEMMYKAELSVGGEPGKYNGFMDMMAHKMSDTFETIGDSISKNIIDPLKAKLGIDDKFKERFKNTIIGAGAKAWGSFKQANQSVYGPIIGRALDAVGMGENSAGAIRTRRGKRASILEQRDALQAITNLGDERLYNIGESYGVSINDYDDLDAAKAALNKQIAISLLRQSKGGTEFANKKSITLIRKALKEMEPDEAMELLRKYGGITEFKGRKRETMRNNAIKLFGKGFTDFDMEPATGNAGGTMAPFMGRTMLSKGELLFNSKGVSAVRETGPYNITEPTHILNSGSSHDLMKSMGMKPVGPKTSIHHDLNKENDVRRQIYGTHAKGTVDPNMTIGDLMNSENMKTAMGEAKKLIPEAAAGGVIGGLVSLMFGLVGGPLLGAGVGAGASILAHSETLKDMVFGPKGENGERGGGLLPKNLLKTINKYLPDMTKFGLAGIIPGLLTPLGPFGGLAVGAGIGLLKNTELANKHLFGVNTEDGVFGGPEEKQILMKYGKGAGLGAGAGAVVSVLMGGPFGLVANAGLGAAFGLMTTSDEFQEAIMGKKINGIRVGGLVNKISETFDPLKRMGLDIKDFLFGKIETGIIQPIHDYLVPLAHEIPHMAGIIPKFVIGFFNKKIGPTLLGTIERIGGHLTGFLGRTVLGENVVGSAARRLGNFGANVLTAPTRFLGWRGNQLARHQIKAGRGSYMFADERLRRMRQAGYADDAVDVALAGIQGDDENALENLSATTALLTSLATGKRQIEGGISKNRAAINKTLNNFKASTGKRLTGKQIKDIGAAIQKGDYNSFMRLASSQFTKDELEEFNASGIMDQLEAYKQSVSVGQMFDKYNGSVDQIWNANQQRFAAMGISKKDLADPKRREDIMRRLQKEQSRFGTKDMWKDVEEKQHEEVIYRFDKLIDIVTALANGQKVSVDDHGKVKVIDHTEDTTSYSEVGERNLADANAAGASNRKAAEKAFGEGAEGIYESRSKAAAETIDEITGEAGSFNKLDESIQDRFTAAGKTHHRVAPFVVRRTVGKGMNKLSKQTIDILKKEFTVEQINMMANCKLPLDSAYRRARQLHAIDGLGPNQISNEAFEAMLDLGPFLWINCRKGLANPNIRAMILTRKKPIVTAQDVKYLSLCNLRKTARIARHLLDNDLDGKTYRTLSDMERDIQSNKYAVYDEDRTATREDLPDVEGAPEEGHFLGTLLNIGGGLVRGALGIGKAVGGAVLGGAKALGGAAVGGVKNLLSRRQQQAVMQTGLAGAGGGVFGGPLVGAPGGGRFGGGLGDTGEVDRPDDGREVVQITDGAYGKIKRGTDGSVELDMSDANTKAAMTKLSAKERAVEAVQKAQMKFYAAQEKVHDALKSAAKPESPIAKIIKALLIGGFLWKSGILKALWKNIIVPVWTKHIWPTITDIWTNHFVPWWTEKAWPWLNTNLIEPVGGWLTEKLPGFIATGAGVILDGLKELLGFGEGSGILGTIASGIGTIADFFTGGSSKNTPKDRTLDTSKIDESEMDNVTGMKDSKGNKLTYREVQERIDAGEDVYNAAGVKGTINEDGTVTFETDYIPGTHAVKTMGNTAIHALTQSAVAGTGIKAARLIGKGLSKLPFVKAITKPFSAVINAVTAPGAKLTGVTKGIQNRALNKVGELAAAHGDEAAFATVDKALDKVAPKALDIAEEAAEQTGKKQGKIAKLVSKLKGLLEKGLKWLSETRLFQNKIAQAAVQLGKKPAEFITGLIDHLKSTFDDIIEKGCAKFGLKISAQLAAKLTIIIGVAQFAYDFGKGCDQAEAILGVSECGVLETITAGIINAIGNLIIVPAIFPGIPETAQLIYKFFGDGLKERQQEAQAEYQQYIKENQVDWSFEEYMKRKHSFTGAAGGWLKDRGRDIKNAVGAGVGAIKSGFTSIVDFFTGGKDSKKKAVEDINNGVWHYTADLTDEEVVQTFNAFMATDQGAEMLQKKAEEQAEEGGGYEYELVLRATRLMESGSSDALAGYGSNAAGTFDIDKTFTAGGTDIDSMIRRMKSKAGRKELSGGGIGSIFGSMTDIFGGIITKFAAKFGDIAADLTSFKDEETDKVISKAEKGEISIFSKDYWGKPEDMLKNVGFSGAMKTLYTNFTKLMTAPLLIVQGVINGVTGGLTLTGEYLRSSMSSGASSFSDSGSTTIDDSGSSSDSSSDSAAEASSSSSGGILSSIKKNGLIGTIKKGASKLWKGVKSFFGKGRRGPRPMFGRSAYSKQIDPSIANIRFNSSLDSEYQTIGDSACGPAAAVNVIESVYGTGGGAILNASKYALKHGYKETDGGTRPEFFTDYFRNNGLGSDISYSKSQIEKNINSGMPTVIMGKDPKGTSSATPFGSTPHYVTVTGTDGKGNAIVQDPESRYDNQLYPMNNIIKNTTLGVSAYGKKYRHGRGIRPKLLHFGLGRFGRGPSKMVVVGDSRTVGMKSAVSSSGDVMWICESGKGYQWFTGKISEIKNKLGKDVALVVLLGINDGGGYLSEYASKVNDLSKSAGATYYVSINPIDEAKYHRFKNSDVQSWNNTLKSKLNDDVKWIDTFDLVLENMKSDSEGLHYDNATYKKIWDKITDAVGSGKGDSKDSSGDSSSSDSGDSSSSSSSSSANKKKKSPALRFKFTYNDENKVKDQLSSALKGMSVGTDLSSYTSATGSFGAGHNMSDQVWWYLKKKGFSDEGAAGVLGNFEQESYNYPPQLQATDTPGSNEYTEKVDKGSISKSTFSNDSKGYGLAQWTFNTRKEGLYNKAKERKTSVGDLLTQLEWMWDELNGGGYPGVLDKVKNAKDVSAAMTTWMNEYEMPGDKAESNRLKFAKDYYSEYKGTKGKEIDGETGFLDDASSGSTTSSSGDSSSSSSSSEEDQGDTILGFYSNVLAKSKVGQVLGSFMGTGKVRQPKYGMGKYGRGNNSDQVWWYLKKQGFTDEGAAAILGNLEQESRNYAPIVQGTGFEESNEYTKKVDSGAISRDDFVHHGPNGGGYGLAQWTWYTRKEGLYDLAKSDKTSIADVGTQMKWLITEMNNNYSGLTDKMKNAKDVASATQTFFDVFEGAGDSSGPARKEFAQGYYKELKGTKGKEIDGATFLDGSDSGPSGGGDGDGGGSDADDGSDTILGFFQNVLANSKAGQILASFVGGIGGSSTTDSDGGGGGGGDSSGGSGQASDVVRIAKGEVGTKEEPDGSNAVKYNDWYWGDGTSGASYPWCAAFVSWVANQAGVSEDVIPKDALTTTAYQKILKKGKAVKNSEAKAGDILYITDTGEASGIRHTGIVVDAKDGRIYTVEGNSGNKVAERDYATSEKKVMLARPAYAADSSSDSESDTDSESKKSDSKSKKSSSDDSESSLEIGNTLGGNGEKPLSRYGTFVNNMYGRGSVARPGKAISSSFTKVKQTYRSSSPDYTEYWDYDKQIGEAMRSGKYKYKSGRGTIVNQTRVVPVYGRGEADYTQLINTIITILQSIADNADKLNLIVNILNSKLGTNITAEDVNNATGNSATLKSTLSAAVMGSKITTDTQKYTDYANSVKDTDISSVMSAVNAIAAE